MVRFIQVSVVASVLFSVGHPQAIAQSEERAGPPKWSVGVLGLANRSPFEAENTDADSSNKVNYMAVPYVAYRGERFFIEGLELGYHLVKPQDGSDLSLAVDVLASARMRPGDSRDKVTADAGLRLSLAGAFGQISATGLQDVTGEHDGTELRASYSYSFNGPKWTVTPRVGVTWQSEKLANYSWGTTAEEHAKMQSEGDIILPIFSVGESVLNYEASLFGMYRFADRWAAIGFASGTWLDTKIRANPGINKKFDATIGLGLSYSF